MTTRMPTGTPDPRAGNVVMLRPMPCVDGKARVARGVARRYLRQERGLPGARDSLCSRLDGGEDVVAGDRGWWLLVLWVGGFRW
jgi:hypothetical protein